MVIGLPNLKKNLKKNLFLKNLLLKTFLNMGFEEKNKKIKIIYYKN